MDEIDNLSRELNVISILPIMTDEQLAFSCRLFSETPSIKEQTAIVLLLQECAKRLERDK